MGISLANIRKDKIIPANTPMARTRRLCLCLPIGATLNHLLYCWGGCFMHGFHRIGWIHIKEMKCAEKNIDDFKN